MGENYVFPKIKEIYLEIGYEKFPNSLRYLQLKICIDNKDNYIIKKSKLLLRKSKMRKIFKKLENNKKPYYNYNQNKIIIYNN